MKRIIVVLSLVVLPALVCGQTVSSQTPLSTDTPPIDVLYSAGSLAITTAGTSEEVLKTVTIPANTLGSLGAYQGVSIEFGIVAAANTHAKTFQLKVGGIGGTAFASQTADAVSANRFVVYCSLFVDDATHLMGRCQNTRVSGSTFVFAANMASITVDFTAAIDLTITATTASGAGDLTLKYERVVLRRKGN